MEKMVWSAPKANVEQFMADEYCVAVCIYLGCNMGSNDNCCGHDHTGDTSFDRNNTSSGCRNPNNQMFKYLGKDADGNYRYTIIEINNNEYSDLQCYLFGSNKDQLEDSGYGRGEAVSSGSTELVFGSQNELVDKTIYWNTDVGVNGYWMWMHHQGTINLQNQQHINRS